MKKIICALIIIAAGMSASGRETPPAEYVRTREVFMAGAGAVITRNPHKGIGTESRGIPLFFYSREKLSLYGPFASYSLLDDAGWRLRGLARMRFEGYEEDDSRYLRGMDDREWTLELGTAVSRAFGPGELTATGTADVLNEHRGHELRLTYDYDFRGAFNVPELSLTPGAGFIYRSSDLNDYYYGVRSDEVIAGRPEYNVGDSTGLLVSLRLNYLLDERWSVMAMTAAEWLGSEITDSPIVEKDYEITLLLGVMYRF